MADIPAIDIASLVVGLLLSFALSFILSVIYIRTHKGPSYSRSFSHTIVFVSITINLIMLIIGSNIARAFALVGAMSIVRFRNPIKDSRDLVFIFMSMAIGMATGTQFYLFSIVFTVFAILVIYGFEIFGFGDIAGRTVVLRVQMPEESMQGIQIACGEKCTNVSIISIDKSSIVPGRQEVIFELELKKGVDYGILMENLTKIHEDISVSLLVGESSVSV